MKKAITKLIPELSFEVTGASYIGEPVMHTAMFITNKVSRLLSHLENVEQCLVFAETGMEVPKALLSNHCFVFSDNPQLSYAEFAQVFKDIRHEEDKAIGYLEKEGSFISKSAVMPNDIYIEPGCLIGHHVSIGSGAQIMAGSIIKNAVIGDSFLCNEHAVIGANGFTMASDINGNKIRIPTLGKVRIGNNVEVGAHDNISCGSGGDTIIEDYVKIDALVHIGHDVHLCKNVEITAGGIVGGFVRMGEDSYVGINSVLRNRIEVGDNALIGMGATVTKSVSPSDVVAGNPAKSLKNNA